MTARLARSRATRGIRQLIPVLLLMALPLLLPPATAAAEAPTKRVLVVTSYDLNRPAVNVFMQAMRATVRDRSQARVEFFYEYQENTRISIDRYEDAMVGYLRRKYEGEKFDLVIALGAPSLKLLLNHESEVFTETPKIFYFHDEREETVRSLWPHVTGVWADLDIPRTLDVALALQPETRRVVVVSGSSAQDKFLREQAQRELGKYESKVEIDYLNDLTMEELKKRLAALPAKSIVLYLSFFLDSAGDSYSGPEALSLFAPASSAPVYGISETYMGAGIVGGSLIDFDALGKRTGEVGLRILNGEKPQDIPPQTLPNQTVFDWRELRRRGLSGRELPPGSVVRFKEPTFWELYKWYVVAATAAFIVEALLIIWLLVVQRRRRRAELDRERYAGLAEAEHRHLDEIVSNVPGIVWETVIDSATDTRRPTFISDYVEKMLGYTAEEWLSSPVDFRLSLMPDENDRERATRNVEAVIRTGKEAVTQFRWRAKDGRVLWVESHLNPILDKDGRVAGLRGVSIDVTEKKLAEDARRQGEERNRAILHAIPDLMFLQTPDGVYLDYHAKDPNELYVTPEGVIGKNMRDVLPAELAAKLLACFQLADGTGEPQVVEYELSLKARARWFEARIVRSGENILSVVRDVTERRQAAEDLQEAHEELRSTVKELQSSKEELRKNEAQLAGIIGSAMDAIITVDEGRRIVLFNAAAESMFGRPAAEAIGQPLDRFIPERFRQAHTEHVRVFGETNVTRRMGVSGDLYGLKSSGEEFPVEASISQIELNGEKFFTVILRDITERKAADEALRQSEARFRNMADTAPVLIWMAGTDNLCTYVNQRWLDFTGRSLDEELGTGWVEGIHPEDYASCLETFASSFGRREPFTKEYRLRRADGAGRWLLDTGTPRFSSTGEFLGYIGSCVDITDRKESEVALQAALEEVSRLKNQLQEENVYLREEIKLEHNFSEIVGHSDAIKYVLHKIEQVAPTDSTVLITGETGTGKELVARAVHGASPRRERPLVKVNCAALSPTLIESELFGHEKGAFTDAASRKIGRFELADGATIFLDEIGELPPQLQVKLLRVIQEGEFERLGSARTIKVDVRIIAATNRNLRDEVQKGRFREDLWYRLNVYPITVPPLRQRAEDIGLLVEHLVGRFSKKLGKKITSIAPATLNALRGYSWPGNVRELANVIERSVISNGGPVLHISNISETLPAAAQAASDRTLEEVERKHISTVLADTGGRIEGPHGAARILGLNPSTLRTRMAKLKIPRPRQSFV